MNPISSSRLFGVGVALSLMGLLTGCGQGGGGAEADGAPSPAEIRALATAASLDGNPIDGHDIPPPSDALTILGKNLFFSSALSGSGDVSCASCHHPLLGGGDGLSLSVGVEPVFPDVMGPGRVVDVANSLDPRANGGPNVPRNASTIFNVGLYNRALFHDGRVFVLGESNSPGGVDQLFGTPESPFEIPDAGAGNTLLAVQARFPVTSIQEMRGFKDHVQYNRDAYRAMLAMRLGSYGPFATGNESPWLPFFVSAFGVGDASEIITFDNIAKALDAYQKSQVFVDSPWSAFLSGDDSAINPAARRGARLFLSSTEEGGANCVACHRGDHFTDERFHILAMPQIGRGKETQQADFGRYVVSRNERDRFAFRTPSLLNVSVTGPYGHAGAYSALADVVRHHLDPSSSIDSFDFTSLATAPQFQGLNVSYVFAEQNTRRALAALEADADSLLEWPLALSDRDVADLVSFLEALTDPCVLDASCLSPWIADPAEAPDSSVMSFRTSSFSEGLATRPDPGVVNPGSAPDSSVAIGPVIDGCLPSFVASPPSTVWGFSEESAVLGLTHQYNFDLPFDLDDDLLLVEVLGYSAGVAPVDINGDCLMDLYVVRAFDGPNRLYVNQGVMGYEERAADYGLDLVGGYSSVAFADLDGDGDEDLLAGKANDGPPELWLREGGFFTRSPVVDSFSANRNSFGFSVGDVDGDNDLDVFIAYWDIDQLAPDNHLWLNNGDATFEAGDAHYGISDDFPSFEASFSPAFVDYDLDGLVDVLLTSDQRQSKVFRNLDGESFANATDSRVITDTNGMGAAIADFDRDGDPDWFVSSIDAEAGSLPWTANGNRLYQNSGDGTFSDRTDLSGVRHGQFGWGACAADFNNDGLIDIFQTNGFGSWPPALLAALSPEVANPYVAQYQSFAYTPKHMFLNNGDGTFADVAMTVGVDGTNPGLGVVCHDADNDGDIDIFVGAPWDTPYFYRNNASGMPDARSITVILEGRYPNSRALGAKVEVITGGDTQTQWVSLDSNYNSHNPARLHFGVGSSILLNEIRVTWPGGGQTTHENVSTNRFIVLRQP